MSVDLTTALVTSTAYAEYSARQDTATEVPAYAFGAARDVDDGSSSERSAPAAGPRSTAPLPQLRCVADSVATWVGKLRTVCRTKQALSAAWLAECLNPVIEDAIRLLSEGEHVSCTGHMLAERLKVTTAYIAGAAQGGETLSRADASGIVLRQLKALQCELAALTPRDAWGGAKPTQRLALGGRAYAALDGTGASRGCAAAVSAQRRRAAAALIAAMHVLLPCVGTKAA